MGLTNNELSKYLTQFRTIYYQYISLQIFLLDNIKSLFDKVFNFIIYLDDINSDWINKELVLSKNNSDIDFFLYDK